MPRHVRSVWEESKCQLESRLLFRSFSCSPFSNWWNLAWMKIKWLWMKTECNQFAFTFLHWILVCGKLWISRSWIWQHWWSPYCSIQVFRKPSLAPVIHKQVIHPLHMWMDLNLSDCYVLQDTQKSSMLQPFKVDDNLDVLDKCYKKEIFDGVEVAPAFHCLERDNWKRKISQLLLPWV